MSLKQVESGTLWVHDGREDPPPVCEARIETNFVEVTADTVETLVPAVDPTSLGGARKRLAHGRRCFALKAEGQTVAYGWVTLGSERVGELERAFNLPPNEAYVWDCVTRPEWRGNRLYSHLLSRMMVRLLEDGVARIWIGASRQNRPSVRGMENAGFKHVLDLDYRRLWKLVVMWFETSPTAPPQLVSAGRAIIVQDDERRFGCLVLGWYPHANLSQARGSSV